MTIVFVLASLLVACGPSNKDARRAPVDASGQQRFAISLGAVRANDVAALTDGGALVVGSFRESVTLGPARLESAGREDGFAARVAANGDVSWAIRIGGTDVDRLRAVAVHADQSVIVVGEFRGEVKLGGAVLRASGSPSAFVARLSADGELRWARPVAGALYSSLRDVRAVGTDAIVVGQFAGAVEIGGHPHRSAGLQDAVAIRYRDDGEVLWGLRMGGASSDLATAVAVAPDGSFAVVGSFSGVANIGTTDIEADSDRSDAFVARFGADAELASATRYGGAGYDIAVSATVDDGGRLFIGGLFSDRVQLGLTELRADPSAGFVAQIGPSGVPFAARKLGDSAPIVAGDKGGLVVATTAVADPLDQSDARADVDAFIVSLDGEGKLRWRLRYGGPQDDTIDALDVGTSVVAAGTFSGKIQLGKVELSAAVPSTYLVAVQP